MKILLWLTSQKFKMFKHAISRKKISIFIHHNQASIPINNHPTIKLQSYSERNKLETFQANIWKELKMLQHMPNLLLFSPFSYTFSLYNFFESKQLLWDLLVSAALLYQKFQLAEVNVLKKKFVEYMNEAMGTFESVWIVGWND